MNHRFISRLYTLCTLTQRRSRWKFGQSRGARTARMQSSKLSEDLTGEESSRRARRALRSGGKKARARGRRAEGNLRGIEDLVHSHLSSSAPRNPAPRSLAPLLLRVMFHSLYVHLDAAVFFERETEKRGSSCAYASRSREASVLQTQPLDSELSVWARGMKDSSGSPASAR